MSTNYSHIARFWALIIDRRIMFDREFEIFILSACGRPGIFANMRCGDGMFLDFEARHIRVVACWFDFLTEVARCIHRYQRSMK